MSNKKNTSFVKNYKIYTEKTNPEAPGLVCTPEMDWYEVDDDGKGLHISEEKKLLKHEEIQKGMSFINSSRNVLNESSLIYADVRHIPKDPYEFKEKIDRANQLIEKVEKVDALNQKKIKKARKKAIKSEAQKIASEKVEKVLKPIEKKGDDK